MERIKSYRILDEKSLINALRKITYCRLAKIDVSARPLYEIIDEENNKIVERYNTLAKFYEYIKNTFHLTSEHPEERHTSPFGMYHFIGKLDDYSEPEVVYSYVNGNPHTYYWQNEHKILLTTRHIIEDAIYNKGLEYLIKKYGDVELSPIEILDRRKIEKVNLGNKSEKIILYDILNKRISEDKPRVYMIDFSYDTEVENGTALFVLEYIGRASTHQLVRHQSFGYQQQSQRYVIFHTNKNKRLFISIPHTIYSNKEALKEYVEIIERSYETYKKLIEKYKIKGEDSRSILPTNTGSVIVMGGLLKKPNTKTTKIDGFLEFCQKRMQKHAQWEIKAFSQNIYDMIMKKVIEISN